MSTVFQSLVSVLVVIALAAYSYGEPDTPGLITTHVGGQAGVYGTVSSGW